MLSPLIFITIIIVLAWSYDFFNGANDSANSIATTISTKSLSPLRAILLVSLFNIIGAFITTRVAATIGKGIIFPRFITHNILIASLVGAIIWAAFSTRLGIPISVTHALIGGLVGAGLVAGGWSIINWKVIIKILLAMFLAPIFGFLLGGFIIFILFWIFRKSRLNKVNDFFRRGQIFSSSFVALTHGMNDAQNAMGVITIALLTQGFITNFKVPWWVILGSGVFMGLGTYLGGWRVIKTLGVRIADINPVHGFTAEFSSFLVIAINTLIGLPISTTQVISTSLMGAATIQRRRSVRWRIARDIVLTWIFTIPGAAILSGLTYLLLGIFIR